MLREAERNAVATQIATAAGMDALIAALRDVHGVILGVKNEAKAFYGPSSDQVAALGLKKESEQSRRGQGKKGTEGVYIETSPRPPVEAGGGLVVGLCGRTTNAPSPCQCPLSGIKVNVVSRLLKFV